jgi:chromosome segregation ATPase
MMNTSVSRGTEFEHCVEELRRCFLRDRERSDKAEIDLESNLLKTEMERMRKKIGVLEAAAERDAAEIARLNVNEEALQSDLRNERASLQKEKSRKEYYKAETAELLIKIDDSLLESKEEVAKLRRQIEDLQKDNQSQKLQIKGMLITLRDVSPHPGSRYSQ